LDNATLSVTSDVVHQDEPEDNSEYNEGHHIDQTDKPRAGIAAEYLAKGYILSEPILKRAIEIDNERGISKRFLGYINHLDQTIGARALGPGKTVSGHVQSTLENATQQARAVDEQRGISKKANDYYSKALSSPLGERVRAFYTTTAKQVQDIHEEARRLTEARKAEAARNQSEKSVDDTSAAGSAATPDAKAQAAPTVI